MTRRKRSTHELAHPHQHAGIRAETSYDPKTDAWSYHVQYIEPSQEQEPVNEHLTGAGWCGCTANEATARALASIDRIEALMRRALPMRPMIGNLQ